MLKIYASIWSNDKATEMAKFYKSIFKGTKISQQQQVGNSVPPKMVEAIASVIIKMNENV